MVFFGFALIRLTVQFWDERGHSFGILDVAHPKAAGFSL
jgi:hypothetical protein